jgi:hypothetical protein
VRIHQHVADDISEPGLCSPEHAHLFTRSLGLSHLDAVLKGSPTAQELMEDHPAAALQLRGVSCSEHL